MKIFAEQKLSDYLDSMIWSLEREVYAEDRSRLLNVNESTYIDYLIDRYRVEPLVFRWDIKSISDREEMVPAEWFPRSFDVQKGKSYLRQIITYHIPFVGDSKLLRCRPSRGIAITYEVRLEKDSICLDIVNYWGNATGVNSEAQERINDISTLAKNVEREVKEYNNELEKRAQGIVKARRMELLSQANLMASLGIPIRKAENVPPTFSVPITPKKVVKKPAAPSTPYEPEYALPDDIYQEILRIIFDLGRTMERLPSLYRGKEEEDIRDFLLMSLTPHFESVTGETFNKGGKTDILIRHDNTNVFVAECKFWDGIKAFHDTIDQILGYLTWRDSKAAIVCFVRNKKLDPVLEKIKINTPDHACFLKHHGMPEEGWYSFEFHLPDDPTRGVQLAVLCFHFPPS
jgi:hypothetical protein